MPGCDAVAVRLACRLRNLPQHGQLCRNRHAATMIGRPQVQPPVALIVRIYDPYAQLGVHHVERSRHTP